MLDRYAEIDPQVSLDLYSCVDVGTPGLSGVDNLYDNYRYVLPYMTKNFEQEFYVKFQAEILQTDGLYDQEKAFRVIPVWSEFRKERCRIGSLKVLPGFNYLWFTGNERRLMAAYCDVVKNTITKGRRSFP